MRLFLVTTSISLFAFSSAFAADLGQYRAGNAYQSVLSPSADVCDSHCSGDAQCRSWNFVRVNPRAQGVCEFNQNDVTPVPSAISISGTNAGQTYQAGVVSGSTNTIRIGSPVSATPQARAAAPKARGQRRIVRKPVPQQHQAQSASTRPVVRNNAPQSLESLTAQQSQYRNRTSQRAIQSKATNPQAPRYNGQAVPPQGQFPVSRAPQFQHDLGGRQIASTPRVPTQNPNTQSRFNPAQNARPQIGGHQQRQQRRANAGAPHVVNQGVSRRGQPFPPQPNQQAAYRNAAEQGSPARSTVRPQTQAPQRQASQRQAMTRRPANTPITYGSVQNTNQPPNVPNGAQQTQNRPMQGLTAEQAQRSLFGKLNDDVRVPNSGSSIPSDPNAPIPTQASRPSTPVQQSNLGGLAGPPQR